MKTAKVLLTGFEPFGEVAENPSQQIVTHFAHAENCISELELATAVLPVVYDLAGERLKVLLAQQQPDAVLLLGVAARREGIHLERVALNLMDAPIADNAGRLRKGQRIDSRGPAAYWSTLPLERLQAALSAAGIPAQISNHAGAYLCNYAFFVARRALEQARHRVPCGFVHLPALGDESPNMPLVQQIEAVRCLLEELRAVLLK